MYFMLFEESAVFNKLFLCMPASTPFIQSELTITMCYVFSIVSGICQGHGKGDKVIAYEVELCTGCSTADVHTGGNSIFNIFVEELRLTEVKKCSGSPANCDI